MLIHCALTLSFVPLSVLAWRSRAVHTAWLAFVLAVSVGLAVAILFGWHCYLVLTAQTTIEFYGNHTLRLRARVRGERFRNPYDRGYANNFRQVFGAAHPLIAVLPSSRKPPGAPWPAPRARATVDVV